MPANVSFNRVNCHLEVKTPKVSINIHEIKQLISQTNQLYLFQKEKIMK